MALAFLLGLVIATAGTATAARLITGKQIKDGSVASRDLSKGVRKQIAKTGAAGSARRRRAIPGPVDGRRRRRPDGHLPGPDAAPARRGRGPRAAGPSCITTFDILCGDAGAGNYWTQAGGASFGRLSYFVGAGRVRPVPGRGAAGRHRVRQRA